MEVCIAYPSDTCLPTCVQPASHADELKTPVLRLSAETQEPSTKFLMTKKAPLLSARMPLFLQTH
jgi:hypothetical protein